MMSAYLFYYFSSAFLFEMKSQASTSRSRTPERKLKIRHEMKQKKYSQKYRGEWAETKYYKTGICIL